MFVQSGVGGPSCIKNPLLLLYSYKTLLYYVICDFTICVGGGIYE